VPSISHLLHFRCACPSILRERIADDEERYILFLRVLDDLISLRLNHLAIGMDHL
jgi:hypothetical protein